MQRDFDSKDVTARIQEMAEKSKEKRTNQADGLPANVVRLPIWPEAIRGVPNGALRSALFAAIQGKDRQFIKDELLAAVDGIEIRFRGEQLDQVDLDVWQQALQLVRVQGLGEKCRFTAHSFLKALGRETGGEQHEWLKTTFLRLTGAVIDLKMGGKAYFGTLVEGGMRDDETGDYEIWVNPKMRRLFDAGWTQVEWEERQALRRKPLALWLHGWYCSHAKPYPLNIATIHRLSGSRNKSLADFRRQLVKALDDLKAIGAIEAWEMRGDIVDVIRKPTLSQQKHLAKKSRKPRHKPV